MWPQAPLWVINYFLQYSSDLASQEYNDYCCVKLMLHHLFERFTDLLSLDRCDYRSYINAFQACRRLHTHPDDFYTDPVADGQDTDSKDDESVCSESNDKPL